MECPKFKLKVLGQYRDALTRQITEAVYILEKGSLNKRNEFRMNEICRLGSKFSEIDSEKQRKIKLDMKFKEEMEISNFIENLKLREKK